MKKSVWVCAAVLLLVAFVPKPAVAGAKINFGLKAGMSMSNVKWSDDDGEEKALWKPTFGIFAQIDINETLAIQPELNYLTMGEMWEGVNGVTWKEVYTQNYLWIPVLIKARLTKEGSVVPNIFAGPAAGILLSARYIYTEDGTELDNESVKEWYKSVDFGAVFGVGAEFPMSNFRFIADIRYYLGLTQASDYPDHTLKNNALIFAIGAAF